jgi:hypothetical protein
MFFLRVARLGTYLLDSFLYIVYIQEYLKGKTVDEIYNMAKDFEERNGVRAYCTSFPVKNHLLYYLNISLLFSNTSLNSINANPNKFSPFQ